VEERSSKLRLSCLQLRKIGAPSFETIKSPIKSSHQPIHHNPSIDDTATMPDYGGGNQFAAFAAAFPLPSPDVAAAAKEISASRNLSKSNPIN